MDVRGNDELRALRERAYGPDADIHLDPVAQARLRELETVPPIPDAASPTASVAEDEHPTVQADETWDVEQREQASLPTPPPLAEAVRAAGTDGAQEPDGARPPDGTEPLADTPAARGSLSRRTIWVWAASVALALVVGAGVTAATSSFGGIPVAVLPEVELTEWPTNMFGDAQEGARVFEVFEGTRVLVVPNAWGSPDSEIVCVFVVRGESEDGSAAANEILTTGCGAGAFAPTASFTVTERSPAALRDRFPIGTSVRVTVEGDEVRVFTRSP